MKKDLKYNLVIYSSLLFAIICMFLAVKGHYDSLEQKESFSSDIKEAIKEINTDGEEIIETKTEEEPSNMIDVDKKTVINNILNDIVDNKIKLDVLSKEMILTWDNYEITNIEYIRQITDDYYCYKVDIEIFNLDANVPVTPEYNEDYITLSLYFNISYNEKNSTYNVKTIEIPNR